MDSPHPQPENLGYQTALDLGVSALDAGVTHAAVGYLSRAVEVRPTRFALVQLATALRDQGQLEPARQRLLQARALPDGENPYVVVTLAAVLCDLNEYEDALTAAHAAVDLGPSNPAALNVAARCVRELAGVLERSPAPNHDALIAVRACADDFARRAAAADPEPAGDMLRRRRERTVQARLVFAAPPSVAVSDADEAPDVATAPASGAQPVALAEAPRERTLRSERRMLAVWQPPVRPEHCRPLACARLVPQLRQRSRL